MFFVEERVPAVNCVVSLAYDFAYDASGVGPDMSVSPSAGPVSTAGRGTLSAAIAARTRQHRSPPVKPQHTPDSSVPELTPDAARALSSSAGPGSSVPPSLCLALVVGVERANGVQYEDSGVPSLNRQAVIQTSRHDVKVAAALVKDAAVRVPVAGAGAGAAQQSEATHSVIPALPLDADDALSDYSSGLDSPSSGSTARTRRRQRTRGPSMCADTEICTRKHPPAAEGAVRVLVFIEQGQVSGVMTPSHNSIVTSLSMPCTRQILPAPREETIPACRIRLATADELVACRAVNPAHPLSDTLRSIMHAQSSI